jgi:Glycosyl transferase family 2
MSIAATSQNSRPEHDAKHSPPLIWPRISLVTPVFNSAKYIERTIQSVLAQNYPNLEYIIVDGGSTDGTIDIIRQYQDRLTGWISEPDQGMYDALNKGFARTTGEIMGWISATDLYHVGGLAVVGSVFTDLPKVEWITGRTTIFNEAGMTTVVLDIPHWSRFRFLAGANRYIQQESTFWRRSLWQRAGSRVDDSRRYAADFELWVRFFRYAQLHPVDALIGGFRVHGDSLGLQELDRCHRIQQEMIEEELRSVPGRVWVRGFRGLSAAASRIRGIRGLWQRLVMNTLYWMPGPDWPPVIEYRDDVWLLRSR